MVLLDLPLNLSEAAIGGIARLNHQGKSLLHLRRNLGRIVAVDIVRDMQLSLCSSDDVAWFQNAVRKLGLVRCVHLFSNFVLKTEATVFGLRIPDRESFIGRVHSM